MVILSEAKDLLGVPHVILSEAKNLLGVPHVILSEAKDLSLVEEEIPRPFGPRNDKKVRILAMTERAQ